MRTKMLKGKIPVYLFTVVLILPFIADSAFARGGWGGGWGGGGGQNNAPTISNQSFNVDENSANATVVGTVSASDPDGDSLSYSITGGNTSGAFAINTGNGQLTVANSAVLDYETITQFGLTVQVVDPGGLNDSATITVALNDIAEGGGDPEDPPGSSPYPAGEALYNSTCFACHGNDGGGRFVRRSIRGFEEWTISGAINNTPSMHFLSYLSSSEHCRLPGLVTVCWKP